MNQLGIDSLPIEFHGKPEGRRNEVDRRDFSFAMSSRLEPKRAHRKRLTIARSRACAAARRPFAQDLTLVSVGQVAHEVEAPLGK
jgi:hypothetical protein